MRAPRPELGEEPVGRLALLAATETDDPTPVVIPHDRRCRVHGSRVLREIHALRHHREARIARSSRRERTGYSKVAMAALSLPSPPRFERCFAAQPLRFPMLQKKSSTRPLRAYGPHRASATIVLVARNRLRGHIMLCVALACIQWSCTCPSYCGDNPPASVCDSGTVPQVVQKKIAELRYDKINSVSACDPVGMNTNNQGVDIRNVSYRAVAACDSKIHLASIYAHEDMYPIGSEDGLAIGAGIKKPFSAAPLHSMLASELMSSGKLIYHAASSAYPISGLAKGTGNFCFGTNITPEWQAENISSGNIALSGAYDGYLEIYIPVTYCVPPELRAKSIILSTSDGVPGVRSACNWSNLGGTPIPSFPAPYSTFEGCAQQQNDCLCSSNTGCRVHPYQEWPGGQCERFAWECWCDCG
jgi:hypothetical protein